jgi:hypothetical protein
MMHTESRQPATGPKPWTLETMPHPSRYDEKGMAGIGIPNNPSVARV